MLMGVRCEVRRARINDSAHFVELGESTDCRGYGANQVIVCHGSAIDDYVGDGRETTTNGTTHMATTASPIAVLPQMMPAQSQISLPTSQFERYVQEAPPRAL